MPTRQLRSIVTADRQGLPALGHDRIQHSCHPSARETGVYFQGQTFPGVRVHHTQHPDRPPAVHLRLMGRFAICACDTGCSICDVEVSTCVAMLETATCWVSPATFRTRLAVMVSPTVRLTLRVAVAKLLFCALTSYDPRGSRLNR